MEEKKCKFCAMMIPKEAKVCPHCRKKQGTSTFTWIVAFFFIFAGFGMCQNLTSTKPSQQSASYQPPPQNTEPVLELQSWNWREEHGYAIAEGAVKNISGQSLKNVVAVMQTYDKQGNFIKSDDALIDYRPILPGQTSPFKVMSSFNPSMEKARLDFKEFSGGTLLWKKKEVKKK